jgi:hypothetical protein
MTLYRFQATSGQVRRCHAERCMPIKSTARSIIGVDEDTGPAGKYPDPSDILRSEVRSMLHLKEDQQWSFEEQAIANDACNVLHCSPKLV